MTAAHVPEVFIGKSMIKKSIMTQLRTLELCLDRFRLVPSRTREKAVNEPKHMKSISFDEKRKTFTVRLNDLFKLKRKYDGIPFLGWSQKWKKKKKNGTVTK